VLQNSWKMQQASSRSCLPPTTSLEEFMYASRRSNKVCWKWSGDVRTDPVLHRVFAAIAMDDEVFPKARPSPNSA
jgi:hypothetical protein